MCPVLRVRIEIGGIMVQPRRVVLAYSAPRELSSLDLQPRGVCSAERVELLPALYKMYDDDPQQDDAGDDRDWN